MRRATITDEPISWLQLENALFSKDMAGSGLAPIVGVERAGNLRRREFERDEWLPRWENFSFHRRWIAMPLRTDGRPKCRIL